MARVPEVGKNLSTEDLFALIAKESEKKFKQNPGAILDDYSSGNPQRWYSTGIPSLDLALGGGLAGGMCSMFGGIPNAGKSTLLYSAIAEAQRMHPEGDHDFHIIADPENSTTVALQHMRNIGVDTSKVFIIAPEDGVPLYAEDIFERIEYYLRLAQKGGALEGRLGIIGIDSIGGLVSSQQAEQAWDKAARVGGNAGVITRFIRNTVNSGLLFNSGGHMLFLNQVRDAIGDMWTEYVFPGGKALEHACVQIISVTRTLGDAFKNKLWDSKKDNQLEAQFIGQKIKFKQEKSKVGGIKGATASVNYYYKHGLDILQNMIDMASMYEIVTGTTWKSLIDPLTGEVLLKKQGIDGFKQALANDIETYKKFEYLLTYTMRGLEIKSVVDDWEEIHMELFGEAPPTVEEVAQDQSEDSESEEVETQ